MKSSLEIIRERVVEVVPRIMRLEFGCIFTMSKGKKVFKFMYDSSWQENAEGFIYFTGDEDLYDETWKLEVLGREIQLADVLRAIPDRNNNICHIEADGTICSRDTTTGMIIVHGVWNLSKPLSGQSQETWDFLAGILK